MEIGQCEPKKIAEFSCLSEWVSELMDNTVDFMKMAVFYGLIWIIRQSSGKSVAIKLVNINVTTGQNELKKTATKNGSNNRCNKMPTHTHPHTSDFSECSLVRYLKWACTVQTVMGYWMLKPGSAKMLTDLASTDVDVCVFSNSNPKHCSLRFSFT